MSHKSAFESYAVYLLATGLGAAYFLAFLLCADWFLNAVERDTVLRVLPRFVLAEAVLAALVYASVRFSPLGTRTGAAKVIMFVPMGAATLVGLYGGALMGGVEFGLGCAIFTAPAICVFLWASPPPPPDQG